MNLGLLLLLLVPGINSQLDFDRFLERYDSIIKIWVFGYQNQGNLGFNRGCCFTRNDSVCSPCRYRTALRSKQRDPNTGINADYFYETGVFSRQADILFETFYFEKLYSWFNMLENEMNFFITERGSLTPRPVETMQKFRWNWYGDYEFDGSYGDLNRMKAWIILSFSHVGYETIRHVNLILQSVVFDQYKLASGECCVPEHEDVENFDCSAPCSFKVAASNGIFDYITSRDITALNNTNTYTYNLTLGFYTNSIDNSNRLIFVRFLTPVVSSLIDTISLRSLNLFRQRTYYFNNQIGISNNVRANISLNLYCTRNAGNLCSITCDNLKSVDSCDNENGVPTCLNGATDIRKCENFVLSCDKNPCLNNGTCKMKSNDQLLCICQEGYSGKYCEDISCDQKCKNRGLCVSPNKCICEYPFYGDNCQFQECDLIVRTMCKNGGFCFYESLVPKCNCVNKKFRGETCEIAVCEKECLNGICISSPTENINKCFCYEGFTGTLCDQSQYNLQKTRNAALLPLLVITAALTFILIILSTLKYKGIILSRNKPKLNLSTDELR